MAMDVGRPREKWLVAAYCSRKPRSGSAAAAAMRGAEIREAAGAERTAAMARLGVRPLMNNAPAKPAVHHLAQALGRSSVMAPPNLIALFRDSVDLSSSRLDQGNELLTR